MIDRTWKIAIAVGLTAALCAIVLSFFSGTNLHWNTGDGGGNFEIRVGIGNGFSTGLLGSIAIICLLLGAAFLAATQQPKPATDLNTSPQKNSFLTFLQTLTKSETDYWLGGVCGGLGAHTPVPSWVWRVIFLILILCMGTGVLAYVVLWICLPEEKKPPKTDSAPGEV
jgi:phage shock protein PspC (stress-responsive transcriptional regulator)